jgi:hypothetical protein
MMLPEWCGALYALQLLVRPISDADCCAMSHSFPVLPPPGKPAL